ncbi:MAG: phasin family protein, partial [Pseudolabrys sp.]
DFRDRERLGTINMKDKYYDGFSDQTQHSKARRLVPDRRYASVPCNGAATAETTTLMKDSYSAAVKGAQDYNTKFIEFARANTEAAFEFVQKLSSVKSPSEFFELSTIHSREQFETLGGQAKELTALAQKITLATAEPIKTGANKTFSQLS